MKLFFLSLLLLVAGQMVAQPVFNVGVKAGVNSSKITEKSYEFTSGPIEKMQVGVFARFGGVLYVQPEAYISGKGGKMTDFDGSVTKFNLKDIDIPVLFGLKIFNRKNINLRVMAGPAFCFVKSKSIDYEIRLYAPFDSRNFKDYYRAFQYGAGVDFWKITLDARMENGIDPVYEPNGVSSRTDGFINSKNKTFMLTLGYKIF